MMKWSMGLLKSCSHSLMELMSTVQMSPKLNAIKGKKKLQDLLLMKNSENNNSKMNGIRKNLEISTLFQEKLKEAMPVNLSIVKPKPTLKVRQKCNIWEIKIWAMIVLIKSFSQHLGINRRKQQIYLKFTTNLITKGTEVMVQSSLNYQKMMYKFNSRRKWKRRQRRMRDCKKLKMQKDRLLSLLKLRKLLIRNKKNGLNWRNKLKKKLKRKNFEIVHVST